MIVGIDEAGRGAWAGPLVAAAVLGNDQHALSKQILDSKQLSKMHRMKLFKQIISTCEVGIGWVEPQQIDQVGLTASTTKVMEQALAQISGKFNRVVIDGAVKYLSDSRAICKIKADQTIWQVGAASIVAKVSRDLYMNKLAEKFLEYGFEKHVGYGTLIHQQALKDHGVSPVHRLSFKPMAEL